MNWGAPDITTDYRYVVVDPETMGEVGNVSDIVDGTINRKYLSTLKEGASFNYSNTADVEKIGNKYLRVYLDATTPTETTSEALGTFIISTPTHTFSEVGTSGTATGYSLLQVLNDEHVDSTLTIPAGTNLIQYACTIITARGLQCIADDSSFTSSSDASFDTDASYLDVVIYCTQQAGFGTPTISPYGAILLSRYQDPTKQSPVRVYDALSTVLFPEVSHELDIFSVPNKVIVVSNDPENVVSGYAINDDPSSPFSTVSRGRVITAVYSYDNITTQAEAEAKARSILIEQSAVESWEISHLYDGSKLQDVIGLEYVDSVNAAQIVDQEISLTNGCPVKERVRRFI